MTSRRDLEILLLRRDLKVAHDLLGRGDAEIRADQRLFQAVPELIVDQLAAEQGVEVAGEAVAALGQAVA